MVKRLIQGLLLGLLVTNFNAYALGLGKIQLDSALNQPLSAEIELLSASPEDADSVQVSLASYETFSKVGIDRPSILALLRFNVASKGGGYVIKIDSHEPIREPFLDFILEVTWSSGRVLREYTLLLDPPELKRAQPAQIQAPTAQPAETPMERAAPVRDRVALERPTQRPQSQQRSRLAGTITPTDKGGISYGPVRRGETLWSIAKEMRSDSSVSTQQMLMALLEENPNAFIAGDINRLKRGSILRLNNPAIIGSISRQEAAMEVAQRTQPSTMRKSAGMDEQLITADTAEAKRPILKLVTPDKKSPSERMGATVAEGGDSDALRQELMLALEISEAQRRENDVLKERMSDLQEQLNALKRLVTLKDSDLAQIQQQFSKSGEMLDSAPAIVAPVLPKEELEVAIEVGEPAPEATAQVIPDIPEAEEQTIAEVLKQEEKSAAAEESMDAKPEVAESKITPKPAPRPKIAPVIKKPVAEPDFFSSVISDPMFMTAGGATLVLILLLILLIIKKRGNRFHESILSGDASSMGATAAGGPDTSFLSDLAISGLAGGGMEADEGEVDPLTEADVYMAYGRTKQAESLLKDALESNPDRLELKGKLLEVYFTAKDKEQFDAIIADAAEQLQEDEAAWNKILIMGHELSPENSLFEEAPEPEMAEAEEMELTEGEDTVFDDVLDIGIDLDELSAEMESSSSDELDIDLGLDFSDLDNDIFSSSSDEESEEVEAPAEELESFELGDLEIDSAIGEESELGTSPEVEKVGESEIDDGSIDFDIEGLDLDDLSVGDEESGEPEALETLEEDKTSEPDTDSEDIGGLDFSMDDLDVLESGDSLDLSSELDDALSSIDDDMDDIGDLADLSAETDEAEESSGESSANEFDIDSDLEFDLAGLDDEVAVPGESDEPVGSDETGVGEIGELDDFDFDFESTEGEESTEESADSDVIDTDLDLDLNLSGIDESPIDAEDDLKLGEELGDLGDLDFDIIDDESLDVDGLDEFDLDIDDSELDTGEGDMDTKIDLAKAYIEMGDADGARNMLNEVISQGDDNQKQQAQDLLDSI